MKTLLAILIGLVLGTSGAFAQAPKSDEALPRRLVNITAEEGHTIKEVVLKDMKVRAATVKPDAVKIGEKAPDGVSLQTFPDTVTERVSQVRSHKFFVLDEQVVVVGPNGTVADIVK